MLQHANPKPLIEPEKLKSEADWIAAGHEASMRQTIGTYVLWTRRLLPPREVAGRSTQVHAEPLSDGTICGIRWVPLKRGVALSLTNCAGCHLLYLPGDTPVPGAPSLAGVARGQDSNHRVPLIEAVHGANHAVTGATPFLMGLEPLGDWLYQAYDVPWQKDDTRVGD